MDLSSLEAKIVAKIFALAEENEITSRPFIIIGIDTLLLFKIWLQIFQNSLDLNWA